MYIPCTNLYILVCYTFFIYTHVCQGMYSDFQWTDGYIHFMKCTDIIELCTYTQADVSFWFQLFFCPAG